jgi:hypothetical protein
MPAATASATTITPAAIHQAVALLTCLGAGAGTVGETGLSARVGMLAGTCSWLGTSGRRCRVCAGATGTVAAFAFVFFFVWVRTGGGGGWSSAGAYVPSSANSSSLTVAQGEGRTVQSDARA